MNEFTEFGLSSKPRTLAHINTEGKVDEGEADGEDGQGRGRMVPSEEE